MLGEGLTFEGKRRVLGIESLSSGVCIATAAGPGETVTPIGARHPVEAHAPAVRLRAPVYYNSLRLAPKLLAEECERAAQAAAQTNHDVKRDAEFDASIESEHIDEVIPIAPTLPSVALEVELVYRPGTWGDLVLKPYPTMSLILPFLTAETASEDDP